MSDVRTETRLAKVVHIADHGFAGPLEVVINRGAHQGVKLGDRFLVFGIGPRIVDPDTREDLGELELVRGRGKVVHVQEHLATLRTTELRRTRPAKRVVREAVGALSLGLGNRGNVIEEELAPETEMPFEAVRLGDLAKPI
jgi:hypothetical protein